MHSYTLLVGIITVVLLLITCLWFLGYYIVAGAHERQGRSIDIRVNERDWKRALATGNAG